MSNYLFTLDFFEVFYDSVAHVCIFEKKHQTKPNKPNKTFFSVIYCILPAFLKSHPFPKLWLATEPTSRGSNKKDVCIHAFL